MNLSENFLFLHLVFLVNGCILSTVTVGSVVALRFQWHTEELTGDALKLYKSFLSRALYVVEVNQSQCASELLSQDLGEGLV